MDTRNEERVFLGGCRTGKSAPRDTRSKIRGGGFLTEMHTVSGLSMVLSDPSSTSIDLWDIAVALGNICRFNGHVDTPYSVLSHSLVAYDMAPLEHKMEALLHDASEAYTGDIILPMKELFPEISEFEHRIGGMIFNKYAPDSGLVDNGVYKKSPYLNILDGKLAIGESFVLRHAVPGVYYPEVERRMIVRMNATPPDFIKAFKEIGGKYDG